VSNRKGPNDDPRSEKKSKGGLAQKWAQVRTDDNVTNLGWDACDSAALLSLVTTITDQGGAVILGITRDGGALMVTVLDGDSKLKEYVPNNSDVTAVIWSLVERLA